MRLEITSTIQIDKITVDPALQMRDGGVDVGVVAEYAEAMVAGVEFPPVTVFQEVGKTFWLADGFHRVAAARQAGKTEINAVVTGGSRRDAMLAAVGVNASHGLRRTNADKRRAVLALLRDPDWNTWSDREIAKQCAVGNKFVGDVRRSIVSVSEHGDEARTYTTKHGTVATMKVAAKPSQTTEEKGAFIATQLGDDVLFAECERRGWEVVR